MDDVKRHFSICSCHSAEHVVHWNYDPAQRIKSDQGNEYDWPSEVWFEICVSWNQSFFKRCWNAVRYVFGHRSVYGHFDCFVLEKPEARKLVAFLQDYVQESDEIRPV